MTHKTAWTDLSARIHTIVQRPKLPHGLRYGLSRALLFALIGLLVPGTIHATSQWSRKLGITCTACHTPAFPRLNYYGEKFQLNGYQDIGTQDGDETGKQAIGERLFADDLGNFLGVRLNVVPLKVTTNAVETEPGNYESRAQVGNFDWMQLFTAGTVFKNVSIFIETEFNKDDKVHTSWFRFGFHNLFGTPALNARVGVMDPLEIHAASGRLPMIPPARQEVFYIKSSKGSGDDSVDLRGGRPAVAFFGLRGPVVWELGVDNGKTSSDPNTEKNFWGTVKFYATSGPLEGSSISIWAYRGTDSKNTKNSSGTFTGQIFNSFQRFSPSANLRWNDLDIVAAWVKGTDDNWTLASSLPLENSFTGILFQAGRPLKNQFYASVQYDAVTSDTDNTLEFRKATAALSYAPRENWRIILMPRFDILPITDNHPRTQHEFSVVIRTML